jgi:hypothetical protein
MAACCAALLAVARVAIDRRLGHAGARDADDVEPDLLDLPLPLEMIREEVAGNAELRVGNGEVPTKERRWRNVMERAAWI